ncbi:hypothetical protein [Pseudescherichia sp.]|uniref:hypothetical protein n=1 Tax=Pseudescherichia sp. TaxID=2055881 RepID=UPI0028A7C672|nr:hypothetical protein [Pseudescherichia sp.]
MNNENDEIYTLFDERGIPVVYAATCDSLPDDALYSITHPNDLKKVGSLVAQACQGAINTHGRTVELVFKPEIQQGLKDGSLTMMKTTAGETLADAVHASGKNVNKIAGKGRIVEAGKLKQLATGSFQLISLMVAQAHLADINKNLSEIKSSLDLLHKKLEANQLAKIEGRIHYLESIIEKLRNGDFDYDISLQIKNKIEDTVADAYEWQSVLFSELRILITEIKGLQDSDRFGTGDTYNNLKTLVENASPLIQRRNLLLKLSSLLAYIQACIDPTKKEFSFFDLQNSKWQSNLRELVHVVDNKTKILLSNARFNSQEILDHRKYYIINTLGTIKSESDLYQQCFESSHLKLRDNQRKILSSNGKLRLAVTLDERGNAQKAAVID